MVTTFGAIYTFVLRKAVGVAAERDKVIPVSLLPSATRFYIVRVPLARSENLHTAGVNESHPPRSDSAVIRLCIPSRFSPAERRTTRDVVPLPSKGTVGRRPYRSYDP